jgi:gas vesicle protein
MEFSMKREEMREEQERMQQVQHQIQMVQKQMDEDAAKQRNEFIDKTNKILKERVPEWNDDEKRAGLTKQIRKYAIDNGYQDNEIDNLIDHRSIEVLIKAMRYDAMQNADVKTKKLKNKPKLIKPGVKRAKTDAARRRKAELSKQLKSSGSVKDAALLFEDII